MGKNNEDPCPQRNSHPLWSYTSNQADTHYTRPSHSCQTIQSYYCQTHIVFQQAAHLIKAKSETRNTTQSQHDLFTYCNVMNTGNKKSNQCQKEDDEMKQWLWVITKQVVYFVARSGSDHFCHVTLLNEKNGTLGFDHTIMWNLKMMSLSL